MLQDFIEFRAKLSEIHLQTLALDALAVISDHLKLFLFKAISMIRLSWRCILSQSRN